MHLHHQKQKSRVFMCWSTRYTAHGAPDGPQKGRVDHEGAVSVPAEKGQLPDVVLHPADYICRCPCYAGHNTEQSCCLRRIGVS